MTKARRRRSDPGAATFSLEDYPFYLMTRAMARYYGLLADALRSVGADQPHWRVLMILGAQNPSNMSELSERAVIKNSTMTRLIQRMQAQGLVRAAPRADDNRISEVFLTAKGEERLGMVRDVGGQIFRHAFGDSTDGEVAAFVATLKTIVANLSRPPFEASTRTRPKAGAAARKRTTAARRGAGGR